MMYAVMTVALATVAHAEPDCAEAIGPEAALDAGVAAIYSAVAETNYLDVDGALLEAVLYHGVADFLARNPNCCSFTLSLEDGFAPTPEWREKHSFYGFVRATFKAYRIREGDAKTEVVDTKVVVVTACGQTMWYDIDDDDW
jgi:hypothetical protein